MPRIDPLQLLKCLSVLLAPNGGIKSKEEVQRLASLMTKFSKKLVSKCIYIQILKTTNPELLGMFMAAGGWNLIHVWLSDAIVAKNWALVQELLELLLLCPVDVERLKTNTCPKLVKGLSKDGHNENVRFLASKLVEQWLRIVKGESASARAAERLAVPEEKPVNTVIAAEMTVPEENTVVCGDVKVDVPNATSVVQNSSESEQICVSNVPVEVTSVKLEPVETLSIKTEGSNIKLEKVEQGEEDIDGVGTWNGPVGQLPVYKITIRDGKQVLAKVYPGDRTKRLSGEVSGLPEDSVKTIVVSQESSDDLSASVVNDEVPVQKEEPELKVEDKIPVKQKSKLEKQDSSSSDSNKVKEIQKKPKEVPSKNSDKKTKLETNKEKVKEKEIAKEKTKDKVRDKEKAREKLKEKSKEKENKEKKSSGALSEKEALQAEKDKATLAKLIPPAIGKLGKIPKKPKTEEAQKADLKTTPANEVKKTPDSVKKSPPENKKSSISIEVRNKDGSRPKTVKKFNSKFRSTGLEEEVKPPPSRAQKKPPIPLPEKKPVKLPPLKRPTPPRETGPAEKKLKQLVEVPPEDNKKPDKAGIKLIPPRPKPAFLQESDMFMDALTASSKKEPRKRKRRISASKESNENKKDTGNKEETTPPSSPSGTDEMRSPPIVKPALKFYQDTMEAEEEKETENEKEEKESEKKDEKEASNEKDEEGGRSSTPTAECEDEESADSGESEEKKRKLSQEETSDTVSTENDSAEERSSSFPKGVLVYHKSRKGPKKLVRWKPEKDLETIRYFELDETERVNVTKNFTDMKQNERLSEREALLARKLPHDDMMEEDTAWLPLIPIDSPPLLAEPGKGSREKDVQYAREKVVLQAIYFNRAMIPDSPAEPDLEIHSVTDPVIIPLDDVTGNVDSVNDFTSTPWPEPKPMIIPQSPPPQYPLPQPTVQNQPQTQTPQTQTQVMTQPGQFPPFGPQNFTPNPMFPNQQAMPNAMPNSMGMMMSGMEGASGGWRTGDGKVVQMNEMSNSVDVYNQGAVPMPGMGMNVSMNMNMGMNMGMGMAMPGNMPGDMNYNMMGGGEEMGPGGPVGPGGPGGPFPPQNFPMGGPPNMFFPNRGHGPGPMRGRGGRGGRGQWFNNQQGGGPWRGGEGGGRGGRGRGWTSRTVCKHFRSGYCRAQEKCPYLHPGVNGPPQY